MSIEGRTLKVVNARDLAEATTIEGFKAGRNVSAVFHPAAKVLLDKPVRVGTAARTAGIYGPYYFNGRLHEQPADFPEAVQAPELSITRLESVTLLPGQVAMVRGAQTSILAESFHSRWELCTHGQFREVRGGVEMLKPLDEAEVLPGRYLYLDDQHEGHYGHFIVDVLSLAWAYDELRRAGVDDLRVLITRNPGEFSTPMLAAMGIDPDRIVRLDRPVICEELFVSTKSYLVQGWTSPTAMSTWARVRDALNDGRAPERLFVSRSPVGNRALVNTLEVEELFRSYGFRVILPENHSIQEQVSMFANAEVMAGLSGSNMFGLAFQSRLKQLFTICSPNLVHCSEQMFMAGHEVESCLYVGEPLVADVHQPWSVDVAELERELQAWMERSRIPRRTPPAVHRTIPTHGRLTRWATRLRLRRAFDAAHYRRQAPALEGLSPFNHYLAFGSDRGLEPVPGFSPRRYLACNGDVARAGIEPFAHYVLHGRREGRDGGEAHPLDPLARGGEIPTAVLSSATRVRSLVDMLQRLRVRRRLSQAFDTAHYLRQTPDLGGLPPLDHYVKRGWRLGLEPQPGFSPRRYLDLNPDVAARGHEPFQHYLLHGRAEGRPGAAASVLPGASLTRRVRGVVRAVVRSRDTGIAKLAAEAGLALEESSGVQLQNGEARFTGFDPQVIFTVPPLDAAVARFDVDLDTASLLGPQLFVDYGRGISEQTVVEMRQHEDRLSALLVFPGLIRRLRFDPSRQTGLCRLRGFGLHPVSTDPDVEGEGEATAVAQALAAASEVEPSATGDLVDGLRRINAAVNVAYAGQGLDPYARWILRHEPVGETARLSWSSAFSSLASRPLVSVVCPVYETPEAHLRAMVESVLGQAYPCWELCLADDASRSPHVRSVIEGYAAADPRIRAVFREANGHISAASNSALELATGAWTVLLDHDDVLSPDALLEVVREAEAHPDAVLVYSDEDKLDGEGRRYDPFFKPDYSPELLRSQNYLNHLTAIRTEAIRAAGGWRRGFEGSQDHDLYLRVVERLEPGRVRHIPKVLYHWRAAAGSTALSQEGKDYAFEAGQRAVREHVARLGLPVERVERAGPWPFHRVVYALPEPAPRVSLIIPTRDRADLLEACVCSITERTDYPDYEIVVVDNGSTEPETHALFARLRRDPRIRVLPQPGPFNYSALNNAAAKVATGSILGLVNNDIEVITPLWLREMASWASQPRIGCVGAKLYYPDDTIQHAGVVLGLGGLAAHSHKHRARVDPGYFHRVVLAHELSAVTAACLLVRRQVWDEVGGLDESLAVAFNDTDFCLRVQDAGFTNIFTPSAELRHHESVSRGEDVSPEKQARFTSEVAFMHKRWGARLKLDPYYSPHLTHAREDYGLA